MAELDVLDVERIIRKAGASRVSEGAGQKLAQALEEKALEIAERAVRLAKYSNRKTITKAEIELALMYEHTNGVRKPAAAAERKPKPAPLPLAI